MRTVILIFMLSAVAHGSGGTQAYEPVPRGICASGVAFGDTLEKTAPLAAAQIDHLFHRSSAKGAPVVLIPGLNDSWTSFGPVVEGILAHHSAVLAYSQRGHGKTADVGVNYSSAMLADDLLSLLDSLHLQKVHLIGHSLGSRTALEFALAHPERVLSVVVEDMALTPLAFDSRAASFDLAREAARLPEVFESRQAAIRQLGAIAGLSFAQDLANRYGIDLANNRFSFGIRPYVSLLYGSQAGSENFAKRFENVTLPILVLAADPARNPVVNEARSAAWAALPNVSVEVCRETGHYIHRENPQVFLEKVLPFLSKQEP